MRKQYTLICEKCGHKQVMFVPPIEAFHIECPMKGPKAAAPKMVQKKK